jgi:hypothetical protein
MAKKKRKRESSLKGWAPLVGRWRFDGATATYISPLDTENLFGIALSTERLQRGSVEVTVRFASPLNAAGRVLFGYHPESEAYFTAGIGGYNRAFVIDELVPGRGWRVIKATGSNSNLEEGREYSVAVNLSGQSVELVVDGIPVAESNLPHPLFGDQLGLFAWDRATVTFQAPRVAAAPPRAFVVMQFAEPFNSLYTEVIKPVAESIGFDAFRADDVFKPGIILQDIIRSIVTCDVIVAEVTPANPNVFYELGYAHAIQKPTILLAEKPTDPAKHLPFDISGFRVIFYDNTIKGKRSVEASLREHLQNIRDGRMIS